MFKESSQNSYNIIEESYTYKLIDMAEKTKSDEKPSKYKTYIYTFAISNLEFGKKYDYYVKGDSTESFVDGPYKLFLRDPYLINDN